jgi:hypothetical protein
VAEAYDENPDFFVFDFCDEPIIAGTAFPELAQLIAP